ncbi:hypothetical protein Tco_1552683 [Tanacetum coccineum]
MENANPPPNNRPVLTAAQRARVVQELHELQIISAFVDSRLENTPLVSPFPHSDDDSDDNEVLNELIEYENVGMLRRERAINSFDGDDLAFQCSFTYIMDFMVLEDIGEFIMSDMAEVLMGKPFRKITKLNYDVAIGLISFTKIFDMYIFRMPRTIPRLRNLNWNKVPPLL